MTIKYRFETLDGMRGIAALAVVFHHLTQHTSYKIFSNSGLAVDLFFCLSGFVVAFSYLSRLQDSMSVREFILRRFVRLYPMFFIGLSLGAIALILKYNYGQTSLDVSGVITAISLNTLYLPYISDFYVRLGNENLSSAIFPTNDPSWSLFFEFAINVVFCIFAIRSKKYTFLFLTLIGMLALTTYAGLTSSSAPGWDASTFIGGIPRTVFGFFSGVLLFTLFEKYKTFLTPVNPLYIFIILTAIFFKFLSGYFWLIGALLIMPALVALGSVSNPESTNLTRAFKYLGWISYPVYCIHFPIYSLFTLITNNTDYGMLTPFLLTPVIILISHFTAKYIEEPIRNSLSRHYLDKIVSIAYAGESLYSPAIKK